MFDVTIYVETSFHGPSIREAAGMYLIEYVLKNGEKETRQGVVCCRKTTENALALEVLTLAFERLVKTCSVRVNTGNEHILNVIKNFWLAQWEKNDWKSAKNKPVKNSEYWKKVAEAKRKHLVSFGNEYNEYKILMSDWMNRGLLELESGNFEKIENDVDLVNGIMRRIREE